MSYWGKRYSILMLSFIVAIFGFAGSAYGNIYGDELPPGPPELHYIVPNSGPTSGGNLVQLGGLNFTESTQVFFGNTEAVIQTRSETSMVVVAPAGSGLDVLIIIRTSSGEDSNPFLNYDYNPPVLDDITPDHGATSGGNEVTLSGKNFMGNTKVFFGDMEAEVMQNSHTHLVVVAPAGSGLNVPVVVKTLSGESMKKVYDYDPPVLNEITPNHGATSGGNEVTLTGKNFMGNTKVFFGDTEAEVMQNSHTHLVVVAPAGSGLNVPVVVKTLSGESLPIYYNYDEPVVQPVITSITPNHGPTSGGNQVTLSGMNFAGDIQVLFGETVAPVLMSSHTQLVVAVPAGSGLNVPVVVNTSSGGSAPFTYNYDAPVITSITPNHGPTSGGNQVTLSGMNFSGLIEVRFGDKVISSSSFVERSQTSVTVISPIASTLEVPITVVTLSGESNSITYFYDLPEVSIKKVMLDNPKAKAKAGQTIEITGTFQDDSKQSTPFLPIHLSDSTGTLDVTVFTDASGVFVYTYLLPDQKQVTLTATVLHQNGSSSDSIKINIK